MPTALVLEALERLRSAVAVVETFDKPVDIHDNMLNHVNDKPYLTSLWQKMGHGA